jgi:succinate dehydrogenase cytochrome b556 subunit
MSSQQGGIESRSYGRFETWAWLLQRFTSLFLLVFLGTHLWILHYALIGQTIDISSVASRLRSPFYLFLDFGLLVIVVFHALNGLRAVLLDFALLQKHRHWITWVLVAMGLVTVVLGIVIILAFVQTRQSL